MDWVFCLNSLMAQDRGQATWHFAENFNVSMTEAGEQARSGTHLEKQ